MSLRILTVAENGGKSDNIVAEQNNYKPCNRFGGVDWGGDNRLKFDIDKNRTLTISLNGMMVTRFVDFDLRGFTEYINEANDWISQEEIVKRLMGVK